MTYPCQGCLLLYACTQDCDTLIHDIELKNHINDTGICPDCGSVITQCTSKIQNDSYSPCGFKCYLCKNCCIIFEVNKWFCRIRINKHSKTLICWNGKHYNNKTLYNSFIK